MRQRNSGRWQAVYRVDGRLVSAGVFPSKADAQATLARVESDLRRGAWTDPRASRVSLEAYATSWLSQRVDLAIRTRELYEYLIANHIAPCLGRTPIGDLEPSRIRAWNAELRSRHPSTSAKAYRLLGTILRTAVSDGLISRTPCTVRGAGLEHPAERSIATPSEIAALTEAMPAHLRLAVQLAAWCQLRRGEILGLRRCDVDLSGPSIRIEQSRTFLRSGASLTKPPKTRAGRRVLAVPIGIADSLESHLEAFCGPEPQDLVFLAGDGQPVTAAQLQRSWDRSRREIGRVDLHFHDLRHTGLSLAAVAGATSAELMLRAGHASADAALRYQHVVAERDKTLAASLDSLRAVRS